MVRRVTRRLQRKRRQNQFRCQDSNPVPWPPAAPPASPPGLCFKTPGGNWRGTWTNGRKDTGSALERPPGTQVPPKCAMTFADFALILFPKIQKNAKNRHSCRFLGSAPHLCLWDPSGSHKYNVGVLMGLGSGCNLRPGRKKTGSKLGLTSNKKAIDIWAEPINLTQSHNAPHITLMGTSPGVPQVRLPKIFH